MSERLHIVSIVNIIITEIFSPSNLALTLVSRRVVFGLFSQQQPP